MTGLFLLFRTLLCPTLPLNIPGLRKRHSPLIGIAKELLTRVIDEAKAYGCGTVQITASDMGVLLYTDFGFVKNGNFMQYKL